MLAGVVVEHLDPVAGGMGYEDAPASRLESSMVEQCVSGTRYLDEAYAFERHYELLKAYRLLDRQLPSDAASCSAPI